MPILQIFDSLSRKQQEVTSLESDIFKLYTCGPTVYNKVHIGNLRAYILPDLIRRALEMNDMRVRWVMNLTDVDDKTIRDTIAEFGDQATPEHLKIFTERYTQAFYADLNKINIPRDIITFIPVTNKISEIQEFIVSLLHAGFAYKTEDGSTYFNIQKYESEIGGYGALVGEKFLEGKKIGARVKVDDYDKDNLADFALWKAWNSADAHIFWDHPELGKGRPGWHIECTVINYDQFPQGTDIHTGGIDLLFPHHTNEIAQAQPLYKPFVKYWVHNEHITVNDEKMSKRLGNFLTLDDLTSQNIADGLDLRYLYLQSHYRTRSNVSEQNLGAAKTGLKRLREAIGTLEYSQNQVNTSSLNAPEPSTASELEDVEFAKILSDFRATINNDLNTPEALSILHQTLGNKELSAYKKLEAIYQMDMVLGLNLKNTFISPQSFTDETFITIEVQEMLTARLEAKNAKNYEEADRLRDEIGAAGYEVIDTPEGQKLRKNQ